MGEHLEAEKRTKTHSMCLSWGAVSMGISTTAESEIRVGPSKKDKG